MSDDNTLGLRERRRRETTADIRHATIDLIETNGWEETTVGSIAARVGISTRTFFRYFDSKEQAALPAQRPLWDALGEFSPSTSARSDVARELRLLLKSTALGNIDDGERDLHDRIARLFLRNPKLHAVAAVQEAAYAQHLHERLIYLFPDEDPLGLRALAESSMALWRVAWWHWGTQLNERVNGATPAESFDAAETALRAYPASL